MSSNLAFKIDDFYGDAATTSVFSRQVRRPLPVRAPRVGDYSISGVNVVSFDEAFRQFRIERIDSSDANVAVLNEVTKTINGLLSLSPGWDTYGGLPTTETAARKAINIISGLISHEARLPTIVPVSDGGVQLEWHYNGWDVEIEVHPDGAIDAFVDSDAFTHNWTNHQLPQDRRFIEALETVTAAPAK